MRILFKNIGVNFSINGLETKFGTPKLTKTNPRIINRNGNVKVLNASEDGILRVCFWIEEKI